MSVWHSAMAEDTMGLTDRAQAVVLAYETGLICPDEASSRHSNSHQVTLIITIIPEMPLMRSRARSPGPGECQRHN